MSPVLTADPEALPVDPRIQERRERVARHGRRRRRRWLLTGLVVLTVATAAWLVTRSALLDVDEIVITGTDRVTVDEVRSAALVDVGDALFDVDAGAVRQRVRGLPWVADAAVRVRWNGTVEILVFESEPVAVLDGGAQGSVLLDAQGRVLERLVGSATDLVVLAGPDAEAPGTRVADPHGSLAVVTALPPGLRARVERVVVTEGGNLDLHLRGGAVAWLGRVDDLPTKLRALGTALGQVDGDGVAIYDVRVPGQVAVARPAPDPGEVAGEGLDG